MKTFLIAIIIVQWVFIFCYLIPKLFARLMDFIDYCFSDALPDDDMINKQLDIDE